MSAGDAIVCEDLSKRYKGAPPSSAAAWGAGPRVPPGAGGPRTNGERPASGVLAVDNLNLRVPEGEFFGLLGPNGAGKTTTIGMLTTRVVPTGGRAFVAGVDVLAHPAYARTKLAAVTQTNTLDRSLSVEENLYFHGRYFGLSRKESRRRAEVLIAQFDLEDKAGAEIETLSGGLAQRVQIARALLHEPEVLFLDEPTSGLDPQSRVQLWEQLRILNQSGQTIVLTTHYMEEADQLCDRVAIMDHGQVLALDSPRGLKASIAAERLLTISLSEPADERLRSAVAALPGVLAATGDDHTLRVEATSTPGVLGRVVAAVNEHGGDLTDLSVSEPSLEAVFLQLTGKAYRE